MKKIVISLLCVLLCFLTGIPCLAAAETDGLLPDPAELLGAAGELAAEDYDYEGYITGDVYVYDLADDDFADTYLALAQERGFDIYAQDVYDAFLLQYDGRSAILFLNDDGNTKLLVETGMEFAGAQVNGPWLPDPCTALTVDGEYYMTSTENGATYDIYTYDLVADYEFVGHFIATYTEALKNIGYTSKKLKQTGKSVWYQQYNHQDYEGVPGAELAVFVNGDAKKISEGGESGWLIVLGVPKGYKFTLGSGAPGIVNGDPVCVGCGGTGNCAGCGGIGRVNYGNGYETCVNCDGTGICNICDGKGVT